ncbi:DNA repair protein RecN [Adhaeribacter radiodurans]|uniref:DNA repair protein RecN n=1 Tax=Adhaeribacter radiodurans TaxID=2745197 RepID=A0A7L7L3N1_9BACT|nr:DNA repair protein RecN [Adhaeribacter radiodurans]QMU27406.1 DNA repair protein RecN [Adhaeribacter radiodurans]
MLVNLRIKNYALIEQLELQPSPLLNIITGETGAGKSIMLGAIGLLLGNRADTKVLFNNEEKCVVEGIFDISSYQLEELFTNEDIDYDSQCILRREITPTGKSRAFINDTPVTLDALRTIGANLMDIHSQHDTLMLGDTAFQLNIVDLYAGNNAVKEQYQNTYRQYKKLESDYKKLESQLAQAQKELDYNTFLLNELEEAKLVEDEQEELETLLKQLEHAEEIKLKLSQALQYLSESEYNVAVSLKDAAYLLNQVTPYGDHFQELKERIDSCLIEINDIAAEVETAERKTEADPEKAEQTQERLTLIYNLQRKHQARDNAELLQLQAELQQKVSSVLNLDESISRTKKQMDNAYELVAELAGQLSDSRQTVFSKFQDEIHALLAELGMPNARIVFQHVTGSPTATGIDVISILFSANKGSAPQTLSKAASGGEFSRLMLCVKYLLADKTALPTIIFDEIDTGISGEIAVKVGKMMQQMAKKHQLIAISHLPQMAAQGDAHYFVFKEDRADRTISRIRKLSEEERVKEIATMIAGANPSNHAFQSARELLAL